MPLPLLLSTLLAIISVAVIIYGYKKNNIDIYAPFIIVLMLDVILGFGFICNVVPIETSYKYIVPESIFKDEKYLVAVYDDKPYCTGESRHIIAAKDGVVVIEQTIVKNSYGSQRVRKEVIRVFSKDEWDKKIKE